MPTFYLRFEDLKSDPVPVLKDLFCFILGVTTIEGTFVERRIQETAAEGYASHSAYKLKDTSRGLKSNLGQYSDAQLTVLKEDLSHMVAFWGYDHDKAPSPFARAEDF